MASSKSSGTTGRMAHGHGEMAKRQTMRSSAGNTDVPHILKQAACLFPDSTPMKKGESMYLQVNYDFKLHPGTKKKGSWMRIWGLWEYFTLTLTVMRNHPQYPSPTASITVDP
ncbi:hypothetical protein Vi05172_g7109 [Venturia inaequalis]|nr:hypothetical protein Vi05172_g7109 [Venturia inaequalis]